VPTFTAGWRGLDIVGSYSSLNNDVYFFEYLYSEDAQDWRITFHEKIYEGEESEGLVAMPRIPISWSGQQLSFFVEHEDREGEFSSVEERFDDHHIHIYTTGTVRDTTTHELFTYDTQARSFSTWKAEYGETQKETTRNDTKCIADEGSHNREDRTTTITATRQPLAAAYDGEVLRVIEKNGSGNESVLRTIASPEEFWRVETTSSQTSHYDIAEIDEVETKNYHSHSIRNLISGDFWDVPEYECISSTSTLSSQNLLHLRDFEITGSGMPVAIFLKDYIQGGSSSCDDFNQDQSYRYHINDLYHELDNLNDAPISEGIIMRPDRQEAIAYIKQGSLFSLVGSTLMGGPLTNITADNPDFSSMWLSGFSYVR
jgi:hypothetical protein